MDFVRREHFSPRPIDARHLRSGTGSDISHPTAEHAIDADEHRIARLDEIDDRGLHSRRSGTADGERHLVLGAHHSAEHSLHAVHDLEVVRIEMSDRRRGEGR